MDKAFEALEVATQTVEDARPLLNQAIELVDEVRALTSLRACRTAVDGAELSVSWLHWRDCPVLGGLRSRGGC